MSYDDYPLYGAQASYDSRPLMRNGAIPEPYKLQEGAVTPASDNTAFDPAVIGLLAIAAIGLVLALTVWDGGWAMFGVGLSLAVLISAWSSYSLYNLKVRYLKNLDSSVQLGLPEEYEIKAKGTRFSGFPGAVIYKLLN